MMLPAVRFWSRKTGIDRPVKYPPMRLDVPNAADQPDSPAMVGLVSTHAARLPPGLRLYAVGDIHGCADRLNALIDAIEADIAHDAPDEVGYVFLGDYIDRGPDSRDVIDGLIALSRRRRTYLLKGNHDTFPLNVLDRPALIAPWLDIGGISTLASYGVTPVFRRLEADQAAMAEGFRDALPESHKAFFKSLLPCVAFGDYFFVHAGINPLVTLADQGEQDLLWIRETFLNARRLYEKVIVHGHTPVLQPETKPNRINLDTGAYATGRLTAMRFEDDRRVIITV